MNPSRLTRSRGPPSRRRALFAYGSENITNQAFWLGYAEMFADYEWFINYVEQPEPRSPQPTCSASPAPTWRLPTGWSASYIPDGQGSGDPMNPLNRRLNLKALPGPDDITRVTLPNGITRADAQRTSTAPSVVLAGYLPAGSLFEPAAKSWALAHFTAASPDARHRSAQLSGDL